MYYLYILKSIKHNKIYIGSTKYLENRLVEHNSGKEFFTKIYKPWKIFYYEAFSKEKLARMREKKLKQHGNALRELKKRIGLDDNGAGFTLIELMIALAVFTIGIVAALGLSLANYNNSRDNLEKIVAVNLAREGIELIRNVRDSNWLKVNANASCGGNPCTWNYSLNVNSDYVYIDYVGNANLFTPSSVCFSGDAEACVLDCSDDPGLTNCKLYKNASGFYNHDISGTPSNYARVIKLEHICLPIGSTNPVVDEYLSSSCGIDTQIGIQVTSHVQWQSNGIKSVEIVDQLYNWRR